VTQAKRLMSQWTTVMPRMTVSGRLDSATRISAVECPPFQRLRFSAALL
jgi:hypothetical protein